jgi:hypothetical protein
MEKKNKALSESITKSLGLDSASGNIKDVLNAEL